MAAWARLCLQSGPLPPAGDFFGDFFGDLAIFFVTFGIFKPFFGDAGFFAGAFFGDLLRMSRAFLILF